jgi:nucleoside-diphosphate-sugar epimerase
MMQKDESSFHPEVSIIGGSGFIGTRLCKHLIRESISFEILDLRLSRAFPEVSKIADIRDLTALRSSLRGKKIIHLAAVHRDDVRDKQAYFETNAEGTKNICILAAEREIEHIIFTSTVAVYGFAPADTGEDGAIEPFNDYGKSKFEGEKILRTWQATLPNKRSLIIVRPTVVFGEGNRGNVFNLLNAIASKKFVMVGSGRNKKSMAYVGNVAAFLSASLKQNCRCAIYNYVDGPDMDMNTLVARARSVLLGKNNVGFRLPYVLAILLAQLAELVSVVSGRSLPVSQIRVKKFVSTTSFSSAASRMTGFRAPFTLEEGLVQTLESEFLDPDPNQQIFFTE